VVDRRSRDELDGLQGLGRLADEMVFALGRVVRGESSDESDAAVFSEAKRLFESIAESSLIVERDPVEGAMFNRQGYRDAAEFVQTHAGGAAVEQYAAHLADLVGRLVGPGGITDDERAEFGELRNFFGELGEATLSRAGALTQADDAPWPQLRQATTSTY